MFRINFSISTRVSLLPEQRYFVALTILTLRSTKKFSGMQILFIKSSRMTYVNEGYRVEYMLKNGKCKMEERT